MSYIIIDRENLRMIGHVETFHIANLIHKAYYDYSDKIVICDLNTKADWSTFTQGELAAMLRFHAGVVEDFEKYSDALGSVFAYARNFPMQQVNLESLEYAAKLYRAKTLEAPPDAPVTKAEKKPKAEGGAPSPKGATGRVWAIADEVRTSVGDSDVKALRKAVIDACIAQGIHEATAATQWSKWKKDKGL